MCRRVGWGRVGKEAGRVRAFKQGKLITLSGEMTNNGRIPGSMTVSRNDFFWVRRRDEWEGNMHFYLSSSTTVGVDSILSR